MWLIARRTFAQGWVRLTATLLAVLFSVGLMAGSLQFALRAQDAVSGSDASEYGRADVLVQSDAADTDDPFAVPAGRVRAERLRGAPGVAAVAGDAVVPVVVAGPGGATVTPPVGASTALRPWVADPRLNPYRLVSGRAPAGPGEVAVSRHVARAGHLGAGDQLRVLLPERVWNVHVVGVVTVDGRGAVASGDLVLAPPEVVRQTAGLPAGTWQRLWVKAAPGVPAATLRRDLAGLLGSSATVRKAADLRNAQSAELVTGGAVLGGSIGMIAMVAVFVGLFVVANTFNTLVRQRARQLALLAAIGARPRQIKRLIRLEALVLGVVASAGGLLVGYGVSEVLTRLFAADGFDISAGDTQLGWIPLAAPVAAGIVVTQLAAWRAARRAALVAPMEALRASAAERKGRSRPRWLAALAIFGASWMFFGPVFAVAGDPGSSPLDRTIATTVLIAMGMMVCAVALAVLTPLLVRPLGGLVGRIGTMVSGEAGRLARATITRNPRRVAAAASALMLGVALAATTGLLVTSVQHRFAETGAATLTAGHVIAAAGKSAESTAPLPADVAARVSRVPGVTRAVALTQTEAKLVAPVARPSDDNEEPEPTYLAVVGANPAGRPEVLRFGGGLPPLRPGEIGLSSSLMEFHHLRAGQAITLSGAAGRVTLTVAGSFRDPSHLFADEALVAPATMARLDPGARTTAVLVRGTASAGALGRAIAGVPGARVYDPAAYVRHAADQFQQGIKVIYGFLGMSLLIALFGMATTVSLSVADRTREFGLLGAVGTSQRQIRSIVRWEAATVVVLGTLLGMAMAVTTMAVLHAATGSSFIRVELPWWLLSLVAGAAAAVALTTSALPARRAAAVPILEATRAE
jgi:putative ABC transport system permease protein